MGLYPDYYSSLRSYILSQYPLPTLDRAYQLAVQEERVRNARKEAEASTSDAVGFALRANTSGRGSICSHCKKQGHDFSNCWFKAPCPHCKRKGHDPSRCFEVVGYPAGWTAGPKTGTPGQSKGGPRANLTAADSQSPTSSSSQAFTAEQWKALSGFIGNAKIPDNRLHGPTEAADWNGN
ncbi:uncharacterized protein LOC110698127 [Chenopodium quinoa]|uniref:uncharacterized protein LOC110698127 n=1 Tax=Chenopodium quinoa TaxID=63459 RepID=UPI000B77D983|nr:uncharacterized protein LOC110698127 [Chenopodium quinoa]